MKRLIFILFPIVLFGQSFPTSIANSTTLLKTSNFYQATLSNNVASTDTTLNIVDAYSVLTVPAAVTIDFEVIEICSATQTSLTVCSGGRGFDSTTATAHTATTLIKGTTVAFHHNGLVSEINAIETTLGPNLSNIPNLSIGGDLNGTIATATLNTVNLTPGPCGDATHICQITTNGKGLVTGQLAISVSGGGGGGGGGTAQSNFPTVSVNGNTLTIFPNCASPACNIFQGNNIVTQVTDVNTVTAPATGTNYIWIYATSSNSCVVAGPSALSLTISGTGPCIYSGNNITTFPVGTTTEIIAMVEYAGGVWNQYFNYQPLGGSIQMPTAGIGIISSISGNTLTYNVDTSLLSVYVAPPASLTSSCSPNQFSFNSNYYFQCTASNVWNEIPWNGQISLPSKLYANEAAAHVSGDSFESYDTTGQTWYLANPYTFTIDLAAQGSGWARGYAIKQDLTNSHFSVVGLNGNSTVNITKAYWTIIDPTTDTTNGTGFNTTCSTCAVPNGNFRGVYLDDNGNFTAGQGATITGMAALYGGVSLGGNSVFTVTTTASATNTVSVPGLLTSSSCFLTPNNASASTMTGVYVVATAGTATITHPATAGAIFKMWCSI